jgi:urease accessory protein
MPHSIPKPVPTITMGTHMDKKRAAQLHRLSSKKGSAVISTEPPNSNSHRNEQNLPFEASALYRLMAWLSPAYPIGAFSYSSGLEWAIEAGDITSADALRGWLVTMLTDGAGFCDAVFFVHAFRASGAGDSSTLRMVVELAAALAPSRERFLETTAQGRAFLDMTLATWPCPALEQVSKICPGPLAYPIAVGAAAAGHSVPLEQSLAAYLQALTANWVSAAVRLIPLGQTDGQRVIAALEPHITATVERALIAILDDAGSATFRADIASMRHETQYTRLFRS